MNSIAPIVIAVIAFLVVIGLFYVISRATGDSEADIDDRLDHFATRETAVEGGEGEMQRAPSKLAESLEGAVGEKEFARNIATDLARANLKLTAAEYLILTVTSILGTALIFYLIMHQNLFLTLGGLVLGFFLPRFYVKFRQGKRLKEFGNQLGDSINLLANGLRSGYSLLQALDAVATEMPPPISEEFQRVVREIGLGVSTEQAMQNMLRRIPSDDLDLMITAISVQHEVGGNLAEILETISHTIRERVRIKGEIRVLTSQQMISGYVVSFLPIGLGLILFAMNPSYMGAMFQDVCGIAMVSIAAIMIAAGFFAIRKIVSIDV
ncbi:MAG: type II secretion system F family protein [Ardenticatenia bacterium]|nr:type II secretion system F family protein [Ardenticatenia bacterium]